MASRQNRVRDQAFHSKNNNSKPQDLIVYTDGSVTKDQSGWGFTVKQCATTPSMKTVQPLQSQPPVWQWRWKQSLMPSAGLPQEVTVTCHHSNRFNELATKSEKWNVSMVDNHLRKLLWMYCPGQAGVMGNDWADRLAGKTTHFKGNAQETSEMR